MPRPKGSKNKPKKLPQIDKRGLGPETITDEKALAMLNEAQRKPLEQAVPLKPHQEADRQYLLSMFDAFCMKVEPIIPDEFPQDAHGNHLFAPRQMWKNIRAYFEATLSVGRPLTLSGMSMFAGLNKHRFSQIKNDSKLHPGYYFLKHCIEFVEMYNEFQLHNKQNPAGPIFVLKNLGWEDKLSIDATANAGALTEAERQEAQKRMANFSE